MFIRNVIIPIALFLSTYNLSAQIARCMAAPPSPESAVMMSAPRNQPITIQVVFHIVYHSPEQNIPDWIITEQMRILNEDFNLEHSLINNIPPYALYNASASGIRFELAGKDPDGNPSSGINRKMTAIENIGDKQTENQLDHIKIEELGGLNGWDPNKYVNIWVGNRTISIGYTVPLSSTPSSNEGLIIHFQQIGTNDIPPYNLGRTLTHEMGHYLGLLHPWGNELGCDNEDDGIADTPFQSEPNYGCEAARNCNIQSKAGNFMDFHDDECLLYFTRGQCLKMQNTLLSLRPSLIKEGGVFEDYLPLEQEVIIIHAQEYGLDIYNNEFSPIVDIQIFDLSGKKMSSINMNGKYFYNFPTEGIPSGIYLFLLKRSEHQEIRKIFIP